MRFNETRRYSSSDINPYHIICFLLVEIFMKIPHMGFIILGRTNYSFHYVGLCLNICWRQIDKPIIIRWIFRFYQQKKYIILYRKYWMSNRSKELKSYRLCKSVKILIWNCFILRLLVLDCCQYLIKCVIYVYIYFMFIECGYLLFIDNERYYIC